jgi:hypothetical protein
MLICFHVNFINSIIIKASTNMRNCLLFLVSFSAYCVLSAAATVYPDNMLISEILFNPGKGGVDFVEIYNPTNQVFDLKDIQIASVNEADSLTAIKALATATLLLKPGQYCAFTTNPAAIRNSYIVPDTAVLLGVPSLPAWNDDAGTVVLLRGKQRIDEFSYTERMHFPLIKNPEGISLERSSFNRPANENGNFRSAAASAGFATPGYRNSQYLDEVSKDEEVYLTSLTFSPDNDGFEDELQLNFRFSAPGMMMNAAVYTERGMLVHHLAKNVRVGSSGTFSWNGLSEQNERLPVGIYRVIIEAFDQQGTVKRYKKNCVLAAKL